ncbi:hypothetical protein B0J11DRAFT_613676 [Dendryphion nanum]|uniref:Uncharacterized protein n=1 Tax=Dendryphion nanum TaxID=256645 RepID=A0A9P9E1W5_9PLEO|nr:hypothetical protein B0J11DRAFT_613676 [Dendryphion nanum]
MWYNLFSILKSIYHAARISSTAQAPSHGGSGNPQQSPKRRKLDDTAFGNQGTPKYNHKRPKFAHSTFGGEELPKHAVFATSSRQTSTPVSNQFPNKSSHPASVRNGIPKAKRVSQDSAGLSIVLGFSVASSVSNGNNCSLPMGNIPAPRVRIFDETDDNHHQSNSFHPTTPPLTESPGSPPKHFSDPFIPLQEPHPIIDEDDEEGYAGTIEGIRFYTLKQNPWKCGESGFHHLSCGHFILGITRKPCGLNCTVPSLTSMPYKSPTCNKLIREAFRDSLTDAEKTKLQWVKELNIESLVRSYMTEFACKYIKLPGNVTETVRAIVYRGAFGWACDAATEPEPIAYVSVEEMGRRILEALEGGRFT